MKRLIDAIVDKWMDIWEAIPGGRIVQGVAAIIVFYLVIATGMGVYWSITPSAFDPVTEAKADAEARGLEVTTGYTTVYTLHEVVSTLLNKPGGYIHNDMTPPGLWLDNISNWEFGVLVQSRDLSRALRKDFSRSQSQSVEVPALADAEPRFNFDASSWWLPSSESEYEQGLKSLEEYWMGLGSAANQDAQFYARADNLNNWLGDIQTRLGSLSQRLSASVGQKRVNTDLAGDPNAQQSTLTAQESEVKTDWLEIDDVFYEARGSAWAILHFLKAIEHDFAGVLEKKNALISLRQIIRELEATQSTVWSPVILNGSGFGFFANHSLVMANYISRANAAIIDLRALLANG